MVICLERGANDLHMVQLMPLPTHHLLLQQIQNGSSFWYQPTQVVLEIRPLNVCVCVCFMSQGQSTPAHATNSHDATFIACYKVI